MKPALTIVAILATLATLPAHARGGNCNYSMNQANLNQCADQEFKTADAHLNKTYRALTSQLGPASKNRLLKSQRAWIAYKEATCAFEGAPSQGGSIHPMVVSNCLATLTRQQTAVLERHLNCVEGDLSCVRY